MLLLFSPYGEALSSELGDVGVWVRELIVLTTVQMSENDNARLNVDAASDAVRG